MTFSNINNNYNTYVFIYQHVQIRNYKMFHITSYLKKGTNITTERADDYKKRLLDITIRLRFAEIYFTQSKFDASSRLFNKC